MDKYLSYLILESISRGCSTRSCIMRKFSGIDKSKIEETLQALRNAGYIVEKVEGKLLKRIKYELTEDGKRLLENLRQEIRKELNDRINKAKESIHVDKEGALKHIEPIKEYLPLMYMLGLIEDIAFLTMLGDLLGIPLLLEDMSLATQELDELEKEGIDDIEL